MKLYEDRTYYIKNNEAIELADVIELWESDGLPNLTELDFEQWIDDNYCASDVYNAACGMTWKRVDDFMDEFLEEKFQDWLDDEHYELLKYFPESGEW